MKVLIAGANSYMATRLIPVLLNKGHEVVCLVRDDRRFSEQHPEAHGLTPVVADLLRSESLSAIPKDIDVAYFLVPPVANDKHLARLKLYTAYNFAQGLSATQCRQLITLGDMVAEGCPSARNEMNKMLREGDVPVTELRTSLIIGPESPAFEIIRQLTDKLSVIPAPRWMKSRCQPIAMGDVVAYLESIALNEKTYGKTLDAGGPDVLSFKQMLLNYAKVRGLSRRMLPLPLVPLPLSSYFIHQFTPATYPAINHLIESLQGDTVCRDEGISQLIPRQCLSYEDVLRKIFTKIEPKQSILPIANYDA